MNTLTVLYDGQCEPCRRARTWLERQAQLVPLQFVPAASSRARALFPQLDPASTLNDLTVIADDGSTWRGAKAWITCLWALSEHRELALRLATPGLFPLAQRFVDFVSDHRYQLAWWLE